MRLLLVLLTACLLAPQASAFFPSFGTPIHLRDGRRVSSIRGGGRSWTIVTDEKNMKADDGDQYDPPIRIGHGWDIHRLAPLAEAGQPCVIGGVEVKDFELGTIAHSDGDVLYHSTVDAILGALTMPDIGQLFPDTDPRWKGCDSSAFLEEAWRLMDKRGYQISNLDVTLVLQRPRVSPIKDKMKENLVRILKTKDSRVNIKARTHEKVDSIGEGRALSCHAVVLIEKKPAKSASAAKASEEAKPAAEE